MNHWAWTRLPEYKVSISYQPNINRSARIERIFTIRAANKLQAMVKAGFLLGVNESGPASGMLAETIHVQAEKLHVRAQEL